MAKRHFRPPSILLMLVLHKGMGLVGDIKVFSKAARAKKKHIPVFCIQAISTFYTIHDDSA